MGRSRELAEFGAVYESGSLGYRNRIINGDMRIDQRNNGASVTPANAAYTIDRWFHQLSQASKISVQRSTTAPAGFINSALITSLSAYSVGVNDFFNIIQPVEGLNVADLGWGTANAQTITISFWVRSSLTGTFGGAVLNNDQSRAYPFTYTISAANTFEQKTVTIAGDTSGTWLTTNGIGLRLSFGLGAGSNYSAAAGAWASGVYISATGATSVVGTNGATFYITGVQLEAGTTATPFERVEFGESLRRCQRYYCRKTAGSATEDIAVMQAYSTSGVYGKLLDLPVTMRANATCNISAASHFRPASSNGTAQAAFSGVGAFAASNTSIVQVGGFSGSSGLTAGNASSLSFNTTSGWIDASAEL